MAPPRTSPLGRHVAEDEGPIRVSSTWRSPVGVCASRTPGCCPPRAAARCRAGNTDPGPRARRARVRICGDSDRGLPRRPPPAKDGEGFRDASTSSRCTGSSVKLGRARSSSTTRSPPVSSSPRPSSQRSRRGGSAPEFGLREASAKRRAGRRGAVELRAARPNDAARRTGFTLSAQGRAAWEFRPWRFSMAAMRARRCDRRRRGPGRRRLPLLTPRDPGREPNRQTAFWNCQRPVLRFRAKEVATTMRAHLLPCWFLTILAVAPTAAQPEHR